MKIFKNLVTLIFISLVALSCGEKKPSSKEAKTTKVVTESALTKARNSFVEKQLRPMKKDLEATLKKLNEYRTYESTAKNLEAKPLVELKKIKNQFLAEYGVEAKEVKLKVSGLKSQISNHKNELVKTRKELQKNELVFKDKKSSVEKCYVSLSSKQKALETEVDRRKKSIEAIQIKITNESGKIEKLAKRAIKKASSWSRGINHLIIKEHGKYLTALGKSLEKNKPFSKKRAKTSRFKGRLKKVFIQFDKVEALIRNVYKESRSLTGYAKKQNKSITKAHKLCEKKQTNLLELKDEIELLVSSFNDEKLDLEINTSELIEYVKFKEPFYGAYNEYKLATDKLNGEVQENLGKKKTLFEIAQKKLIRKYSYNYLEIYDSLVKWISSNVVDGADTLELLNLIDKSMHSSSELLALKTKIVEILTLANSSDQKISRVGTKNNYRAIANFLGIKTPKLNVRIDLPKVNLPKIKLPKIKIPKLDLNLPKFGKIDLNFDLNLNIQEIDLPEIEVGNIDISRVVDIDLGSLEIADIEIEIPEVPVISEFITNLGQFGESFIDDITNFEINAPKVEIIRIEADVEKDLKAPENLVKNSLLQIKDAKEDLDRELTNAYQGLKNAAEKANQDIDRERRKGLKKVGAALKAAGKPENLARIAVVYAASVYGGPMGSALANSLLDKIENPGMSEEDMFKSFVVGAAAGYAAQNVTAVDVDLVKNMPNATSAITRNLTTDLGNVIIKGENYSTEQFLTSLATGAVNSNVGDDFLSEVVDSGINNAATYTINTTVYKQDFDEEAFENALYEGMANGLASETVHALMDEYVLPPPDKRGERYDERLFGAISELIFSLNQSTIVAASNKQLEKFKALDSTDQKEIMKELAEIKEEFYDEYLSTIISAENMEHIDLESEQVQKLYEEYVSLKISERVSEGSVLQKIELTKEEKREILGRDPAFLGPALRAGAIVLSTYGTYETAKEVTRVKDEFDKYREKTGKESFLEFYNDNPEEFESLATDVVISMAFPALKGVKGLAKYGTKGALKIVDSARKLFGNAANPENVKTFAKVLKKYKIEPPKWGDDISFNSNLKKHMSEVDGFTQRAGVKGAHNLDNLKSIVPEKNIKIISQTEHSTAKGIYQVEYQIPKYDRAGNMTGYKESMFKTVYDPRVIPDSEILNLGQIAANAKFKEAIDAGKRAYDASAGGISFRVYINNGVISNVHPKM